MTPSTPEKVRQSLMSYELQSQPRGMWTISHNHFSRGVPFILFATNDLSAALDKLREIVERDLSEGPGAYAKSLGEGHFWDLYHGIAERAAPKTRAALLDLKIDL